MNNPSNNDFVSIDAMGKRFEAAPVYMATIFNQINRMGDINVQNDKGYSNANIDIQTKFIMTLVIDPDLREKVKEYREKRIADEIDNTKSAAENNKKMFDINMDTIGECLTIFDSFMGIVTKKGTIKSRPDE